MEKKKSITLLSIISAMLFIVSIILFAGCGNKELTKIELKLQSGLSTVSPNSSNNLIITTNNNKTDGIEIKFEAGSNLAEISNTTLIVNSSANPGDIIKIYAEKGKVKSKTLTLTVANVEATAIEFFQEERTKVKGEYFTPNVKPYPENCTRPLILSIAETDTNIASIVNNMVYVNDSAEIGSTIDVIAKFGENATLTETFTYEVVELGNVYGVEIVNKNIFNNTLIVDESINATSNVSAGVVTLLNGKDYIRFLNSIKYTFTSNNEDVSAILDFEEATKNITALSLGKVNLNCKLTINNINYDTNLVIDVRIRPEQIRFNENYSRNQKIGTYYNSKNISLNNFIPVFDNARGNNNYSVVIEKQNGIVAKFNVINNEIITELNNNFVTYENKNLKISLEGTYNVYFESLSGCKTEKQSAKLNVIINNGINVSTPTEFANAMNGSANKIVNLVSDIIYLGGNERIDGISSNGDKELNGNGFKIDVSQKDWGVKTLGIATEENCVYNDNSLLNFYSVDESTPFKLTLRDFSMVGNFGNKTLSEISNKTGISKETLADTAVCTKYFYRKMSYYFAIYIQPTIVNAPDTTKTYSYVTPDISNIQISNFHAGIRNYFVYDESNFDDSKTAGYRNLKFSNLFGDGMTFEASMAKVDNIIIDGNLGGSPIAGNGPDRSQMAGPNRNLQSSISLGEIICNNTTDGNSIYLNVQIGADAQASQVVNMLGGMSGIVNVIASTKINYLSAPYLNKGDFATAEKINEYTSNIFKADPNDKTKRLFNLMCFNAARGVEIKFANNNDKNVSYFYNDEIIKGVNTTSKYIYINAYDAIKDIKVLVDKLGNAMEFLKGYIIILDNYNYQEN